MHLVRKGIFSYNPLQMLVIILVFWKPLHFFQMLSVGVSGCHMGVIAVTSSFIYQK